MPVRNTEVVSNDRCSLMPTCFLASLPTSTRRLIQQTFHAFVTSPRRCVSDETIALIETRLLTGDRTRAAQPGKQAQRREETREWRCWQTCMQAGESKSAYDE